MGKETQDQEVNKNPFCHSPASPATASSGGPPSPFVLTDATAHLRRDNKNLRPDSVLFFSSPDGRGPNGPQPPQQAFFH